MKNRVEIELNPINTKDTASQQLKKALELLTRLKKTVKVNSATEKQLDEIEIYIKPLLEKIDKDSTHIIALDCIKKMMEQFNRLAKALIERPTKFEVMNKGQLVLKTFTDIKGVLQEIHKLLQEKQEENPFYDVPI